MIITIMMEMIEAIYASIQYYANTLQNAKQYHIS